MSHEISLAAIEAAAARIAGRIERTPLLSSRTAARFVAERHGLLLGAGPANDGVGRLFVKAERLIRRTKLHVRLPQQSR
jgi:hypothetical protein